MKKIMTIAITLLAGLYLRAQQPQPVYTSNPFPKTIAVSGSAEMEVIPDEIYVNIELKEYQKKGENKKDIETIKSDFLASCKAAGIADTAISIASYTGDNPYFWRKRKKDPNLFNGVIYQVKFTNSELMDKLVEKLDDDATQKFSISSLSHSKITEFRKQLKIQAVKAAKEKATYLADAIGEKTGEAIAIKEPGELSLYSPATLYSANQNLFGSVSRSLGKVNYDGLYTPEQKEIDFKKMKLRFEVEVVFALK